MVSIQETAKVVTAANVSTCSCFSMSFSLGILLRNSNFTIAVTILSHTVAREKMNNDTDVLQPASGLKKAHRLASLAYQ